MSFPGALRNLHICKYGFETGFFRTACIDAEPNLSGAFPHMADTHLGKVFTILGAFNAVVIFSAAEPIPHCLHICRNSRCSPNSVRFNPVIKRLPGSFHLCHIDMPSLKRKFKVFWKSPGGGFPAPMIAYSRFFFRKIFAAGIHQQKNASGFPS